MSATITAEGKEHFAEALQLEIDNFDTNILVIKVNEKGLDEKITEHRLETAKELFQSMAGYCSESDWDKWFKSE